jgi:peptide chain release factor 3
VFSKFTRTARGATMAPEELLSFDQAGATLGSVWRKALDGCELLEAVGADCDIPSFLAGSSTPVFAGSALTDFGVRHLLDAVVELVPSPSPRLDIDGNGRPLDEGCSAFVFKVQANMDKAHRDRLAFARICSGRFERGMTLTIARTGRPFATKYASTVFGAERSTVEEAFPGDVVGLVNATDLRIGDTLHEGTPVHFPGLPSFAPELFTGARPLDTGRSKQFKRGLEVLEEEGVVQVLRDPDLGDSSLVLAAVGQLQFEVFAHRLASEFNAPIELTGSPYQAIRATDAPSAGRLREIGGIRILTRGSDGATVALFENKYRLQRLLSDEPELTLLPLNEVG